MESDWTQIRENISAAIDAKVAPLKEELGKNQELLDRLAGIINNMSHAPAKVGAKTSPKPANKAHAVHEEAKVTKTITKTVKTNGKPNDKSKEHVEAASKPADNAGSEEKPHEEEHVEDAHEAEASESKQEPAEPAEASEESKPAEPEA
ncbi:unnamed protein product [Blepharisma stoltei]|uniref:Uncharacterized protein n=1 Tax=Blepharisma stoltei TaxID=1481888 RepID=A0AAU9IT10_9CILI|nr:unnamed protein product [Blepharisma stoltei]